ncbi:hypothetical protein [Celeribacter ethanolicus]|uniref:hypothetical protein n=1 Tax=Celeribacter ethanolicus TaxID=1758178 RepID=UPI000836DC71|nr:hypothetical protein [Celeribacter ethanolicus]
MNFLPYDRIRPGQWALPFTGSLLFHGAALLLFSTASLAIIPPKEEEPELLISLEILDLESFGETAPIAENSGNIPDTGEDGNPDGALTPPEESAIEESVAEQAAPEEPTPEAPVTGDPVSETPEIEELEAEDPVEAPVEEIVDTPEDTAEPPPPVAPEIAVPLSGLSLPTEQSLVQDNFVSPLAETGGFAPSPFSGDISLEAPDSLFTQPPLPDSPLALAALEPPSVPAPAASLTGPGAPLANASAADLTIGQLLTRIRTSEAPRCTLALPRRGADGQVGLSLIGADRAALDAYGAEILAGMDTVQRVREEVDPRQCAALDALTLTESYPAARIGFSLASTSMQSGDTVEARISGAGGLDIAVLLVDDNGVVQDLARFTTIEDGVPVISAPVARVGDGRETRQILMVLGGDGPFDLTDMDGRTAEEVFSSLDRDQLRQSAFAMASFDVR